MAATYDFEIEQGANLVLSFVWKDSTATPIDLTNYTARMQIRKSKSATATQLDISTSDYITLGDALGTISIDVPASVTAALDFTSGVYDLELVSGDGNATVYRFLQGCVELNKEVTR